jgi:hypothetical protein
MLYPPDLAPRRTYPTGVYDDVYSYYMESLSDERETKKDGGGLEEASNQVRTVSNGVM